MEQLPVECQDDCAASTAPDGQLKRKLTRSERRWERSQEKKAWRKENRKKLKKQKQLAAAAVKAATAVTSCESGAANANGATAAGVRAGVASTDCQRSGDGCVRGSNICRMANSSCRLRVVVDCDYDSLMNVRDVAKLGNQLSHCYGVNRRSMAPLQFYITSFSGKLLAKLEADNDAAYRNWDVNFDATSYRQVFAADVKQLVYLTAESETVLTELDDEKVYVIGGLVDHNHHKGLCHRLALEAGIATARLPIQEQMELNSRTVLTVDHVFSVLLRWSEHKDWRRALVESIPGRKVVRILPSNSDADKSEEDSGPAQVPLKSTDSMGSLVDLTE